MREKTIGNPEQRQTRLISPNELHAAAKATMLGGRDPANDDEWQLIVNFWAANVAVQTALPSVMIMALIHRCPLPDDTLRVITKFQVAATIRRWEESPRVIEGHAVRVSTVDRRHPPTVLVEPKQIQT